MTAPTRPVVKCPPWCDMACEHPSPYGTTEEHRRVVSELLDIGEVMIRSPHDRGVTSISLRGPWSGLPETQGEIEDLSPSQARTLAAWLVRAADMIDFAYH